MIYDYDIDGLPHSNVCKKHYDTLLVCICPELREEQLRERKRIRSRINRLYRYVPNFVTNAPSCVDYQQVLDCLKDYK